MSVIITRHNQTRLVAGAIIAKLIRDNEAKSDCVTKLFGSCFVSDVLLRHWIAQRPPIGAARPVKGADVN